MAQLEEDYDLVHLRGIFILGQFLATWTFRLHWHLRRIFRDFAYRGFWLDLVS